MKAEYIFHSGFVVTTAAHRLVFDYFKGNLEISDDGVTTVFFVSHHHEDHYNRAIFRYASRPETYYVLSRDVWGAPPEAAVTVAGPNDEFEVGGVRVRTLRSTDCGVAYLVEVDGKTVYHAGDLHLWTWDGATAEQNRGMEIRFCRELEKLRGTAIDAAFLPLDPRQEESGGLGFDYAMRTLDIKHAFPMHFWGVGEYVTAFIGSEISKPYRDRIIPLLNEGDSAEI